MAERHFIPLDVDDGEQFIFCMMVVRDEEGGYGAWEFQPVNGTEVPAHIRAAQYREFADCLELEALLEED